MKKKIISLLLIAVTVLTLFTGCMYTDAAVNIADNGTGSVGMIFGLKKQYYDSIKEYGDPFEGKEAYEAEENGNTYICFSEVTECQSYEEIEAALLRLEYNTDMYDTDAKDVATGEPSEEAEVSDMSEIDESDDVHVQEKEMIENLHIFRDVKIDKKSGIFYNSHYFRATLNPQKTDEYEDSLQGNTLNDIYKVSLTVTMPDKIANAENGEINGNSVKFAIDDFTQPTEFNVQSESVNYAVIIGAICVVAVIFIGLIVLTKKKND